MHSREPEKNTTILHPKSSLTILSRHCCFSGSARTFNGSPGGCPPGAALYPAAASGGGGPPADWKDLQPGSGERGLGWHWAGHRVTGPRSP